MTVLSMTTFGKNFGVVPESRYLLITQFRNGFRTRIANFHVAFQYERSPSMKTSALTGVNP